MQISLKYHGENFESFNQLLDPVNNIQYAAKYLRSLYTKHKTWNEAISRYHSSIPKRKKKIFKKGSGLLVRFETEKNKNDVVVELDEITKGREK